MSTTERGPLPREGWIDVGAANPVAMPSFLVLWGEFFFLAFFVIPIVAIGAFTCERDPSTSLFSTLFIAFVTLLTLSVGQLARALVLRALFVTALATFQLLLFAARPFANVALPILALLLCWFGLPIAFASVVPWQRSRRYSRALAVTAVTAVALATVATALCPIVPAMSALVGAVTGALFLAFAWWHRPSVARARWREGTFSPNTGLCVDDARLDASLVPAHYVGPVIVEVPDTALRGAYRDGAARPTAVIAGPLANVEYLLTDRYDLRLARALALSLVCAAPALGHLLRQLAR